MNKTKKTLDQLEAEGQQQEQSAQRARHAVSNLGLGRVSKVVSDEGVAAGVSVLTVGGLPG